jgi:intersectin
MAPGMGMQPGVMTSMPMTMPMGMGMGMQQAMPMMQQVPVSMGNAGMTQQGMGMEWSVPPVTQAKYTAVFQQTDKARSGFLAGVQARNLLLQSGLPQNILAQIW